MPLRSSALLTSALDALSVLSPMQCAGCGADDRALCARCRGALGPAPTMRHTPGGLAVVSALDYEGVARRVILAVKEHGRTDAAGALATALAAAVLAAAAGVDGAVELVVPPTSRASRRRRGFDPVPLLLARGRFPRPSRILVRERRIEAQKSLDRHGRAINTGGAFSATAMLTGRTFLIVDDVLTTGATLDECVRAIRAAGGSVAGGAVVAFTPLRSDAGTPASSNSLGSSAGRADRG